MKAKIGKKYNTEEFVCIVCNKSFIKRKIGNRSKSLCVRPANSLTCSSKCSRLRKKSEKWKEKQKIYVRTHYQKNKEEINRRARERRKRL